MRIIARSKIVEYISCHPTSETALEDWFHKVRNVDWKNFSDMRKSFNSVDYVGNQHYVFNICGNNYRLIAVIKFTIRTVYIRFIGTHAEYVNVSSMKFNSLNFIEQPLLEQDVILRQSSL